MCVSAKLWYCLTAMITPGTAFFMCWKAALFSFFKNVFVSSGGSFSLLVNATLERHANDSTWLMAFIGGDTIYYSDYVDVD